MGRETRSREPSTRVRIPVKEDDYFEFQLDDESDSEYHVSSTSNSEESDDTEASHDAQLPNGSLGDKSDLISRHNSEKSSTSQDGTSDIDKVVRSKRKNTGSDDDTTSHSEGGCDRQKKKKRRMSDVPTKEANDNLSLEDDEKGSFEGVGEGVSGATIRTCEEAREQRLICMICLFVEDSKCEEISQCDSCGIVVHEDCYRTPEEIYDVVDDASSSSTSPWFCDPCLFGVSKPMCEICPSLGGVFKKTDDNRWVHLLCALYIPSITFNDPANFFGITLSETSHRDWGAKQCSACEEPFYSRTGLTISCDVGMCKKYFHPACAQKEGLLSDPRLSEKSDDPYIIQCKQHSDKAVVFQQSKRCQMAFAVFKSNQSLLSKRPKDDNFLKKQKQLRSSYELVERQYNKFVPSAKTPCFLESNPHALRAFSEKALRLGLPRIKNVNKKPSQQSIQAIAFVPAFSTEFVESFLQREKIIESLSNERSSLTNENRDVRLLDQNLMHTYQKIIYDIEKLTKKRKELHEKVSTYINFVKLLQPDIQIPLEVQALLETETDEAKECRPESCADRSLSESAKQKMLCEPENKTLTPNKAAFEIKECCVCRGVHDQYKCVVCDTCQKSYHLGCLSPPLNRMPKRTNNIGWECADCRESSQSTLGSSKADPLAPRRLRIKKVADFRYNNKNFVSHNSIAKLRKQNVGKKAGRCVSRARKILSTSRKKRVRGKKQKQGSTLGAAKNRTFYRGAELSDTVLDNGCLSPSSPKVNNIENVTEAEQPARKECQRFREDSFFESISSLKFWINSSK